MTSRIFRTVLMLMVAGGVSRADDFLPKATPVSAYAKMAEHSPFAPPTAPVVQQAAPTPPPAPGWADSLSVSMIMQDGDAYWVTVIDSQNPQHLYLSSVPDKDSQMSVASVKWGASHDDPPVITLRKGKEIAQVKYELGAASPGGNNQIGGAPPIPGGIRAGVPGVPMGQPFRPPPLANGGQVGAGGPSTAIRRPLIRSQPATPPAGVRPGINQPNATGRPNPAVHVDDDDDDD